MQPRANILRGNTKLWKGLVNNKTIQALTASAIANFGNIYTDYEALRIETRLERGNFKNGIEGGNIQFSQNSPSFNYLLFPY